VQRDGGLAGAGAALDDHQAGRRPGDELELLAVDEGGDLRQVLVGAQDRAVVDAEAPAPAVAAAAPAAGYRAGRRGRRARRLAVAALEGGHRAAGRLAPAAARVAHEGALRRAD